MTISVAVVECVRLPLVPVMVSVKEPVDAALEVEMLNIELPEPLIEVGLKLPVAPFGKPVTVRFTVPVKQPADPTFTL